MTDPIAAVKTAAAHLHAARKFLSTAESVYDKAVAHLALTAETKRLDTERRLDKYGNVLADLANRCDREKVGLHWPEQVAAARLLMDEIEAGRPTAYGPVPNDETNPVDLSGCSRQKPVTASSSRDGDYQHKPGVKT